jgi:hypothetical protein
MADVRLPNGFVVKNVPEGTTKEQLMQKVIAKGLATEADFGVTAPAVPQQPEPQQPAPDGGGTLRQLSEAAVSIPGVTEAAEIAAAVNRSVFGLADIPIGAINEIAALLGSEKRLPTVTEAVPGFQGGFVEPGLKRDILQASGETAALALGTGTALRAAAQRLPSALASEPVRTGVLRQVAATTPAQDITLGGLAGVGAELGEEVAGEPGALIGSVLGPTVPLLAKSAATSTVKSIFRGGEQGRQAVEESIKAFDVSGSVPTLGQATARPSLQAIESTAGKAPGGRPLRDQLDRVSDNIQKSKHSKR